MPDKLDRCVVKVQKKIDAGKLPPKSNPWAICKASIKNNHKPSKFNRCMGAKLKGTHPKNRKEAQANFKEAVKACKR